MCITYKSVQTFARGSRMSYSLSVDLRVRSNVDVSHSNRKIIDILLRLYYKSIRWL